ncbi:energy-coupling factor transporter transmembrane protein EcfT [Cnuibacter physcomitrellae]|uniref:energy-coupling factor transporter transmembrane component T family protein n=1 Tax=Cnuibacter physcomitrellae TaxID=1619308 RepID=UPI002175A7B8|nr:energy-coupling factor transporter transmembrane component T [Cnuibacter physcomitrellae]MCS5499091.1 energy-coupling factor transporter transmembrane protein EcfT [Cnuibacter physcomitrellae]
MSGILGSVRAPRLAAFNAVAKIAAGLGLSLLLLVTIDWVSALVALALEAVFIAWSGIGFRVLLRRTVAIWIAAPLAGLTTALYGVASGTTYVQWGLIHVSDGSIALAIAAALRILAIGLPAVVLFITIDPTDLADGLAQVWHLPSRFVLGALAGMRLVGLFLDDWRQLELARRARGLGDTGRIRRFVGQAFALLVLSIRRGSKLATAMEARGFGARADRTWARPSRFRARDWLLLGGALLVGATALLVSIAVGSFTFVVR